MESLKIFFESVTFLEENGGRSLEHYLWRKLTLRVGDDSFIFTDRQTICWCGYIFWREKEVDGFYKFTIVAPHEMVCIEYSKYKRE